MNALIVVAMLGIVVLGYVLMGRIDRWIAHGGILESPQNRALSGILVYGAPELSAHLCHGSLRCRQLNRPELPEGGRYTAVFALSDDDTANLQLCQTARAADPGICVIVRCSNPGLRAAYRKIGADRILEAGEPIDNLLSELRRSTQ